MTEKTRNLITDEQGVVDKGSNAGVGGRMARAAAAGGISASENSEITFKSLNQAERTSVNYWIESDGVIENFIDLASGNMKYVGILLTDRVKRVIHDMALQGKCVDLIPTKDEVMLQAGSVMRDTRRNGAATRLNALDSVARMGGMYPEKGTGNVNVIIQLTGGLADD